MGTNIFYLLADLLLQKALTSQHIVKVNLFKRTPSNQFLSISFFSNHSSDVKHCCDFSCPSKYQHATTTIRFLHLHKQYRSRTTSTICGMKASTTAFAPYLFLLIISNEGKLLYGDACVESRTTHIDFMFFVIYSLSNLTLLNPLM